MTKESRSILTAFFNCPRRTIGSGRAGTETAGAGGGSSPGLTGGGTFTWPIGVFIVVRSLTGMTCQYHSPSCSTHSLVIGSLMGISRPIMKYLVSQLVTALAFVKLSEYVTVPTSQALYCFFSMAKNTSL